MKMVGGGPKLKIVLFIKYVKAWGMWEFEVL